MKKNAILIALLFIFLTAQTTNAAVTPAPSTNPAVNNQINQLKDKIASQVSKLNLVEKRGIIGKIQNVGNNQVTLTDAQENIRYVDIDEITKFSSAGSSSSFGLSDLKKGMEISVLGIYNKDSQRILARFINTYILSTRYAGEITKIDGKNFQLTITTTDQKTVKVEIDTTSTVSSYSSGGQLTKYGFSKLTPGDRVQLIGYPDKKDATLIIVDRMIDYLGAPKDPNIVIATPTSAATPTPATSGAKSIKPIK